MRTGPGRPATRSRAGTLKPPFRRVDTLGMALACPFSDHPVGTGTFCRICGRGYVQVPDPVLPEVPERELVSVGARPDAAEATAAPAAWAPAQAALVPEEPFLEVPAGMTFELASGFAEQPVVFEPVAFEPVAFEPAAFEPVAFEPAAEPDAAEPDAAEPDAAATLAEEESPAPDRRKRSRALPVARVRLVGLLGFGGGAALMAVLDRLLL